MLTRSIIRTSVFGLRSAVRTRKHLRTGAVTVYDLEGLPGRNLFIHLLILAARTGVSAHVATEWQPMNPVASSDAAPMISSLTCKTPR